MNSVSAMPKAMASAASPRARPGSLAGSRESGPAIGGSGASVVMAAHCALSGSERHFIDTLFVEPMMPAGPSMSRFDPLDYPIAFDLPRRLTPVTAWIDHVPFAMTLIDLV